jgi:autotransporter-associated beta strand protein
LFPADYPWNQNISAAPVAANSAAVIANIGTSIHLHPDWGDDDPANGTAPLYGIPFNVVHGNGTATTNVEIDNYPTESDVVPVPIPPNAVVEGDYQNGPNLNGGGYKANQRGDSHLIVWDEDNNIAYELYGVSRPNDPTLFPDNNNVEAKKNDNAWHAAQETVWYLNTDQFRTLGATSADAAGLSILAGLVRPDEGRTLAEGGQGAINHALRLTLPSSVVNPQYIYPASHVVNDSQASNKVPFGARLRLMNTPAVDMLISHMPPESQIVARAMQQYGLIVADIGTAMYVTGASATIDNVDTPNIKQVWNMDNDILASNSLKVLTASDFDVVDLTPRVTNLSATKAAGGSTISVFGQDFSGAAGHLSVFFGNVQSPSITYVSDSQLNVVVPNGSSTVGVTVQSGVVKADDISSNPNANVTMPIFGYGISSSSTAPSFTYVGTITLTWNGSATGNWTDAKWTGGSLTYPDDRANAAINTASAVQVASSQAAYSLQISGGGQVAVAASAHLTVTTETSVTGGAALNVAAGGIFSTGSTFTLDSGGSVTGASVTAVAYRFNDGTASANLAGAGGLTKSGAGTVTLSGTNSYAGSTTVQSGTLIIRGGGALPRGTSLVIGGTAASPATVVIAATDANENSLSDGLPSGTSAASASRTNAVGAAPPNPPVTSSGARAHSPHNFAMFSAATHSAVEPCGHFRNSVMQSAARQNH